MLVIIPAVLSHSQLQQVRSLLDNGQFVDGRLSAGTSAQRVKNNEELNAGAGQMEQLNKLVMGSLVQNPLYQAAAMPYRVATPYYARYTRGMSYGDHVDDPVMGPPGGQYRSDVSTTVFLNDPDEYQGGELIIRASYGEQSVKLPAGHAVVYPSSSLHHINEVSSGQRLVAVTWTQSMLRDPQQRELCFQLYQAREKLLQTQPEADETIQIDHVYVNLVRMWSEL
jgi:PKHD-type hydroxylase